MHVLGLGLRCVMQVGGGNEVSRRSRVSRRLQIITLNSVSNAETRLEVRSI